MAEKKKKEEGFGINFSPDLLELLAKFQEIELEDFELEVKDLELWLQSGALPTQVMPQLKVAPALKGKPTELMKTQFVPPVETYPGKIVEVKLGATKGEGGTRGRSVIIGGETAPAFYTFERPILHPPVVTLDVFDMEVPLSKAVKMHVKDVIGDPAAWAKLAVEKFGADMVTVHLISIDPLLKDASPKDACKTIEKVLQAVDVPLVIGGCGDPVKDADVFAEIAETFAGERFLKRQLALALSGRRARHGARAEGARPLPDTPMDLNL